jgi:hypothetical protein
MAKGRLVVGAHVLVYVNQRPFGRVAEFEHESDTPGRQVKCVDSVIPAEIVPQAVSFSGSMQIYRLHQDGGIEQVGMTATWQDLPREKYFSVAVFDRFSQTLLFRADRCKVLRQRWAMRRGYVMGTVQFTGILWNNATEPSSA